MSPERRRALAEKLLLTALVFGFFLLGYFLLGWLTTERARPFPLALAWERRLPLVPEMVYAYLLALVLPDFALFGWPLADRAGMRRQALAYLLLFTMAFSIYAAFPMHQDLRPPRLDGDGLATRLLAVYYAMDPPVNLFPSLHCGNATLAALLARRVSKWLGRLTAPLALLVMASAVLVKQHYLADVVAGVALAVLAERVCFGAALPARATCRAAAPP